MIGLIVLNSGLGITLGGDLRGIIGGVRRIGHDVSFPETDLKLIF